jgi:hypothetical protein
MSERSRGRSPDERNNAQSKGTHIEHLLQQTLEDDLPPDVQITMKKQLDQFRKKMEEDATQKALAERKILRRKPPIRGLRWAQLLFSKEVLVVLSLLMIVLGGFIQSSGSSNQLTEYLSVLGTSVAVSNEMSRSHSMECTIQMPRDNKQPLHYLIQWLSPNLSKIQVKESENILLKTIWLSEEELIIADHVNDRVYNEGYAALFNDPVIRPVLGYLAPAELAERMYGEWKTDQTEQKGKCEQRTFTISLPNEKALLEVAVDLRTFLPVSLKKILPSEEQTDQRLILNVRYTWNVPLFPEQLSPKPIKENQKA